MDFFSNTFPDFEAEAIRWKMSRLLWLNVLSKDFPSKRAKRWVENIVLKIVETFFAQGVLLIRANQGHSISTVEVLEMLLLCQKRKSL